MISGGICAVRSAAIVGVDAVEVSVEVSVSNGLPCFSIVGMPDAAVRESNERVRAALKACGYVIPSQRIVVNLAPGNIRKTGSAFDLPIAVALLAATGQIPSHYADDWLWAGELSLDGAVRDVRGLLSYEVAARRHGLKLAVSADSEGAVGLEGLQMFRIRSIADLRLRELPPYAPSDAAGSADVRDFGSIAGHGPAKRALQIAAAGNHGILMTGPPGSGKTLLASALPSILPPLSERQRIEAACVHSVAGEPVSAILAGVRPFRKPHHSATVAGLIGGGSPVRPGEVSLAHGGVLFLDELPEFAPHVLQTLRQPMEQGSVTITRAQASVTMPSEFMFVAAANPCPCGYCGDPVRSCTCTATQISAYRNRVGGPLMDRIDIHIDVWRVDPSEMLAFSGSPVDSRSLADGVLSACEFRAWREARTDSGRPSTMRAAVDACGLDSAARGILERMGRSYALSGRGIVKVLSVARTIADLARSEQVGESPILEALGYRRRGEA